MKDAQKLAGVDVLYISIRSHDDPPVFPPPPGYPSQSMPSDHRYYQQAAPGVNGQQPRPAVIDCACVVYTLRIYHAPPSFSPFNWTAFQFERNKNKFLCSSCYFAAFLPLGSPPPKLTTIFSGPVGLLVRSSMYFLPPPNPCLRSIIDLTPMLPPQFGLLTN